MARLAAQGCQYRVVDSGVMLQRFLAAGLTDELTLTQLPRLLRAGRPLCGALPAEVGLERIVSRAIDFDFVQRH